MSATHKKQQQFLARLFRVMVAQQFEMEGGEDEVEYQKPEVVRVVEAAVAIEGMKPGTLLDNNHPSSPPRSTGAYLSDE